MKIVFQEDALKRIRMARDVEATYTPIKSAIPEWLPGCQPNFELRPIKASLTPPITPAQE